MLDRIQTTLHRRESRPDLEPSRPRQAGERSRPSAEGRDPNRRLLWVAAIVAVLLLVAIFVSEHFDPGFHCVYRVEDVPLRRLDPLTSRRNLIVKGGHLDSRGEFEFGPKHQEVRIDHVTARALNLDYVHTARTAAAEKERASEVVEAAKDQQPGVPVRIVALRVQGGEVGLVDRSKDPSYRVFLDRTDFEMTNFSSGFRNGPAKAKLTGRLMGSGAAAGNATFRPEKDGPDFDLAVAVENASLPKINDVLRAYGKLDVVKGTFSVYSEMKVGDGRIEGYVKPLFADVDVYDSEQDEGEGLLHKLYEKLVGGLSHILDNRPRDEVATVVDISGPIEDPDTSTWTTIARLLRNAFVDAILPGFDREFEKAREEKD